MAGINSLAFLLRIHGLGLVQCLKATPTVFFVTGNGSRPENELGEVLPEEWRLCHAGCDIELMSWLVRHRDGVGLVDTGGGAR